MKTFFTIILLFVCLAASAQWSNTTNQFYDSLHIPVSRALYGQTSPIILQSFPDSGYFVIWEDTRRNATNSGYFDIYAQKYDKNGNRLWAENGASVATGPNFEYYTYSTNGDYRTRSFAATDSAGGFYICYTDDSVTSTYYGRIAVQHMQADGNAVFGPVGAIIATTPVGQTYSFNTPQLVPDGRRGFYIAYRRSPSYDNLYVYNYRDENGTLKYYGGDKVNQNAVQGTRLAACGLQTYTDFPVASVLDYTIWPDGQGGCNVVMSIQANSSQATILGYNKVWRAKKDSRVRTLIRNETGASCPQYTQYKKDSVYLLYQLKTYFTETRCNNNTVAYVVTNTFVSSNGFLTVDQGGYDYNYPKGITLPTDGNINITMLAVVKRLYSNNTVTPYTVVGFSIKEEKFDSIPYQRAAYSDPNIGYNPNEPDNLAQLTPFRDTLLASDSYFPDFSIAGGGSYIYATGLMSLTGPKEVRLQHLFIQQPTPGTYTIQYQVPKAGQVIGRDATSGNGSIAYDRPLVTATPSGFGLFSIRDFYSSIRVSPIGGQAQLLWGAMGRTIGSHAYTNSYYTTDQPVVALDPGNRTAIIAWNDGRYIPPTSTPPDIYMRHLDVLNDVVYRPPVRAVVANTNPYGATLINPIILTGTSQVFSPLEYTNNSSTNNIANGPTIAEIRDDYNLGYVSTYVYLNTTTTIRQYNGQPYLNRNLLLKSEFAPPAGASIRMRLYFTTQEFNAIKAADNSIVTPADLAVIYQPNSTTTTPTTYAPVGGEKILGVDRWDSLGGGYYVECKTSDVGNFFIMKATTAVLCPGGSTTLPSSLTGSSYQWQVNTGSGFTNIISGTNYTGINTATLGLNGIPSFWYGFKYRCIVDGNPSNIISLRFLANWVGTTSTDWNTAGNWGCSAVPDANTDVIINSGNVILNTDGSCRTLTVKPGASFRATTGHTLMIMH